MAKKTVIFQFFFDFLKNCPYDSNQIFYSHSTPYYGHLCAISLNSYGWDVRNIAKFSPKMAKKQSFFDFFDFLTNCSYDSSESESEGKRLKPTPLPHMRLWFNVESPFFLYQKGTSIEIGNFERFFFFKIRAEKKQKKQCLKWQSSKRFFLAKVAILLENLCNYLVW